MEKSFEQYIGRLGLKNVRAWSSPAGASQSSTGGGFDGDQTTRDSLTRLIKTGKLPTA
ncbi:MAG: hypothetical protein OEP48_08925 [Betaproteobacteria bacterium]|nr:hypothetical protein [Betaproteobacteria bacterium]MDH3436428.1 hypothetical protein [Betaproteobacteria bacterium]